MKRITIILAVILSLMFLATAAGGQERKGREIPIHKNVLLVVYEVPPDYPEALKAEYLHVHPLLEEILKVSTTDETPDCALTVRVTAETKKIGSAQTERAVARVVAFHKNAKREFVARLILHSFLTGELVNKEEVKEFLEHRILVAAKCVPIITE
jgi:hypothetical protein